MSTICLVVHPERPQAVALAAEIAAWLTEHEHAVRIPAGDASGDDALARWSVDGADVASGLDLAVSVGGDGTMLRAVHLVVAAGAPVLGINLGRLGYLTEIEPGGWRPAIERALTGRAKVDTRMTLAVAAHRDGRPAEYRVALNDAVVEKLEAGHTVHVAVEIGGHRFLSYAADGMIVATPTGSTAYNLSAGGPIISPALDAVVVTPVAPHSLFDRSMVLDPIETVRLEVLSGQAALAVDGQRLEPLNAGDALVCRAGADPARLIAFGEHDYRQILKAKFGLTDR